MLVFEKPRWARGIGVRGSAEMRTSVRVGDYLRRVPGAATHPKTALRSRRCRRPRATESEKRIMCPCFRISTKSCVLGILALRKTIEFASVLNNFQNAQNRIFLKINGLRFILKRLLRNRGFKHASRFSKPIDFATGLCMATEIRKSDLLRFLCSGGDKNCEVFFLRNRGFTNEAR